MAQTGAARRHAIEAALLDFQRTPGRHTLALRQPALLFASIRDVLQLASDRSPQEGGARPTTPVVRAACFFVRAALLAPDANHYALLGLADSCDAAAIKDRYRQLMRLLHPDFAAASGSPWPADAATRVNLAYEVLSSPEKRRAYDEELARAAAPPRPAPPREAPRPVAAAQERRAPPADPRRVLRRLATGFGAAGGVALVAVWLAGGGEGDSLVQRTFTRIAPVPSAAPATVTALQAPAAIDSPPPRLERQALPPVIAGSATRVGEAPAGAPPRSDSPMPATAAAASPAQPAQSPPPVPVLAAAAATVSAPAIPPPPPPAQRPAPGVATVRAPARAQAAAALAPASPVAALGTAPTDAAPTPATPPTATNIAAATPSLAPPTAHAAAPSPAVAPPRQPAAPAVATASLSMPQVHPQLMALVAHIDGGWGDQVLAGLERDVRGSRGAQALARQLDTLAEGARPVKVARVDFSGEPRGSHFVVTGRLVLEVRDPAAPTRRLNLTAEFADREGRPVLTGLAPAGD